MTEKKNKKEVAGSKDMKETKPKAAASHDKTNSKTSKRAQTAQKNHVPRRVGGQKGNILARYNLNLVQTAIIIIGTIIAIGLIFAFYYMYTTARKSSRAIADNAVINQDADKSYLTRVVNQNSPLNLDYNVMTSIADETTGAQIDDRATKSAQNLLKAAQDNVGEGEQVNILAGYTSAATYNDLYNQKVRQLVETQGLSEEEAAAQVAASTPKPGTDEHSTGLLVNFGVNNTLDSNAVGNSQVGEWLRDNAWRYGFILRYPEGKEASTLHPYDPTAFRYVGEDNAQRIYTQSLSLEEFNAQVAQEEAERKQQEEAAKQAEEAAKQEEQAQGQPQQ